MAGQFASPVTPWGSRRRGDGGTTGIVLRYPAHEREELSRGKKEDGVRYTRG